MVPPDVTPLTKNWEISAKIQQINNEWTSNYSNDNLPVALQSLILSVAKDLHLNATTPTTNGGWANLVYQINNYPFASASGELTPLWSYNSRVIEANAGWAGVCGIFGVVFSLLFVIPLITWWVIRLQSQERKNYRAMAKEALKNYRQSVVEKRENRKKKQKLLEREDRLWADLEELHPEGETVSQQLTQLELEEKIAKTNELREEIEALKQQREELQIANKKNKSNSYRQPKQKKQKIAVPDEELEEIFKSLDL